MNPETTSLITPVALRKKSLIASTQLLLVSKDSGWKGSTMPGSGSSVPPATLRISLGVSSLIFGLLGRLLCWLCTVGAAAPCCGITDGQLRPYSIHQAPQPPLIRRHSEFLV